MRPDGRSKSGDRFVALPHYLLKSDAWTTLSGDAAKLLVEIWKRHNGANNGEIAFSVREAEDIGLKKSVAARALNDLVDRGFLVVTRASAFTVKSRQSRCWRITAEPVGDAPATKDFMRWSPPADSPPSGTVNGSNPHAGKSRTQSPQRDAQSPQRDRAVS